MMTLASRPKKKTVTYGKAALRRTHNKPIDLESDDELASPDKVIILKPTKALHSDQQVEKAPVRTSPLNKSSAKLPSALDVTTPPASRSPSTTSPSSSSGNKRASPFAHESSNEQKRKVRVVGQDNEKARSNEVFDQMFPILDAKKRKVVPKLKNRAPSEAMVTDNTQMLLDSQLQDILSAPSEEEAPVAKKASLKIPSRIRGASMTTALNMNKTTDDYGYLKPKSKSLNQSLKKENLPRKGVSVVNPAQQPRPLTPEKKSNKQPVMSILSPSSLDLGELDLSSKYNEPATTSVSFQPMRETSIPPAASPGKLKLKDRLTSDLDSMVVDVDTTSISMSTTQGNDETLSEPTDSTLTQSSSQQESQKSIHSQASQSQGSRVTYGAARWTFLPDEDEEMTMLDPIFDATDTHKSNNKSRQLPSLSQSSNKAVSFDIESDDEEPTSSMRSLHELKRAGGSQRFGRQAEALLDEFEQSNNKAQRLTSLLELITKLKQSSFVLQFLDAGLETRLLSLLDGQLDTISKFLCCIAVLLVLGNPKLSAVSISNELPKTSAFLTSILPVKSEPIALAGMRNSHIPKDIVKEIQKICGSLRAMSIWADTQPETLTIRIVALKCLEQYARKIRESGNQSEVFSTQTMEHLVDLLDEWPSDKDNNSFLTIQLALSTLESISLQYSFPRNNASESWSAQLGDRLTAFCSRLWNVKSESQYETLVSLSLRLCLNLSNGDAAQCAMFLDMQFIASVLQMIKSLFDQLANRNAADTKQDTQLDNLVLSLGLLINLSEKSERTRELLLQGDMAGDTGIDVLIELFVSRVQQVFEVASEEEARSNVPFGYLAVLLGYLCKNTSIFRRIRSRLDGGNLRFLLIAIGEFLRYHEKVDELQQQPGEGAEPAVQQQDIRTTFVTRLRGLMEELKMQDGLAAPESAGTAPAPAPVAVSKKKNRKK